MLWSPGTRILANKAPEAGCDPISKQVREMPKAFLSHTSASRTSYYHVVPAPSCSGDRHCPSPGCWPEEVPLGSH
ncbi:UNVERIFIED_CONTAM: hypothetical protein Slati_2897600 [Sesamum latifolium]|uniref:Uncharacterized protein n=1 Tax=Sesamum latifolium TaxID=2727402 RepID=A0AAW2VDD1_9LAMI